VSGKPKRELPRWPALAMAVKEMSLSHFETDVGSNKAWKNKKEVKTGSFSPPGVGGVLHDNTLGGSAGLPCQGGLQPHSRTALGNSLGDAPHKELVFVRFVALRNARVNGKKRNGSMEKVPLFPTLQKILTGRVTRSMPL